MDGPGDGLVPVPIVSGSDFGGRLESPEHSGSTFWYWSRCRACAETTSTISCRDASSSDGSWLACPAPPARGRVPLPAEAEETSLGRFFEFALSSGEAERARGLTSCGHALFTQRAHYFSANGVTACVAFDRVTPLRVVSPPSVVPRCATPNAIERDDACDDPAAAVARAMRTPEYAKQLERLAAASRLHDSATRGGESASTVSVFEKTGNATMTFEDARGVSFRVTAYHPVRFDALRRWAVEDGDAGFFASLAKCRPWETGSLGGKSRAMFAKSEDDRFIVKQLSRAELGAFLGELGDAYFRAMFAAYADADAGSDGFGTCLAKILGAFQVRARVSAEDVDATDDARSDAPTGVLHATHRRFGSSGAVSARDPVGGSGGSNSRERVLEFIVMENVLRGRDVGDDAWRTFDLKGSLRARYTAGPEETTGSEPGAASALDETDRAVASGSNSGTSTRRARVLLDANLCEDLATNPTLVDEASKAALEARLRDDTAFLANAGVMDYSLVAGVDARNGELVVGVVDYLRRYTWDKQLESYVKSAGGLGAGEREPTVVSPDQYKKRFRRAIGRYFVAVPSWTGAREKRDGEKPPAAREVATAGLSPRDDGDD